MLKTAAATVGYGLIHSALASRTAKEAAARVVGRRAFDAGYRVFYNAQAIATFAATVAYIRRLPDRELYHARGSLALAMRGGQAAALGYMAWAAWHVGPGRLSGADGLAAWAVGGDVPPAADGQGPSKNPDGSIAATGPFRLSRHPLNVAAPAVLWLQPRMTANLLAFNLAATAYFVAGSVLEGARLRRSFGPPYAAYERSGVPFFLPRPGGRTLPRVEARDRRGPAIVRPGRRR